MKYQITPAIESAEEDVREYWMSLIAADTIKHRLCSTLNPGWREVLKDYNTNGEHMYCIYDTQNREIVAEFELFNHNGDACQIHFSTLPELGLKKVIEVCRFAVREILSKWEKKGVTKQNASSDTSSACSVVEDVPYLHTLVGMTPVSNRAACITVLKIGYEKLGIIPKSIEIARKGTTEDCMLSIITLEKLEEAENG